GPVGSSTFFHGRRRSGGGRKSFDPDVGSRFVWSPGGSFRDRNVHGRRVSRGHENGGKLGKRRYGIAGCSSRRRADAGFRVATFPERNWRLELASHRYPRIG